MQNQFRPTVFSLTRLILPIGVLIGLFQICHDAKGSEPNLSANVTILVPIGATLHINQQPTHQMTAERKFITPPLQPGKRYRYDLEATFLWNGEEITKKKSIIVQSGHMFRVDLMEGETVLPMAPKPDPVVTKPDTGVKKPKTYNPLPKAKELPKEPVRPMPPASKPLIKKTERINNPISPLQKPKPKPNQPDPPISPEPTRPLAPPPRETAPRKGK